MIEKSYNGFYELFILWVYDKEAPLIPDIKNTFGSFDRESRWRQLQQSTERRIYF
jgi:hypothetical protein